MDKIKFKIAVCFLVILLLITTFYMAYVHIPYNQYHNQLDVIRNEICEKNNYQYLDYFNEHHGQEVYYILKIKMNEDEYYVAYNTKKELVSSLKGPFADEEKVKQAINKRYKTDIKNLEVGFENNKFVYCQKIQDQKKLIYVYYSLENGEFVKAYYVED